MDGHQLNKDSLEGTRSKEPYPQTESAVYDANFGQWLTHHLSRLYDPVVNEPLPADLIRALESKLK